MNTLITGTKGFIAKRIKEIATLATQNSNEKVYDMNEDIFDNEDWQEHLIKKLNEYKPNVVFHVGACSNTMETDVNYIMTRNYEFTRIITDWCYDNNAAIIYSSSAACYGNNGLHPSNLYGWSKYMGEHYVIGRGGIALRYFNVYGPGEEHKGRMASMAHQMFKAGEAKLFPGYPERDFVYVDDVMMANLHAANGYNELRGKVFDVGSGTPCSFEHIANLLDVPYTHLDESTIPEGYQMYTCSNPEKWVPGWTPKMSIEKGIILCKTFWQKQLTNQESGQCL